MQASWKASLNIVTRPQGQPVPGRPVAHLAPVEVDLLRRAAVYYDTQRSSFCLGKGATCRDMADSIEKFGRFASERQREFALKLIGWARLPAAEAQQAPEQPAKPALPEVPCPKLFTVLQRHAQFHVGAYKITRRNQDSLCWIVTEQGAVGKIENGVAVLWPRKCAERGGDIEALTALVEELEANPLVAAIKYGRLSGRCCSCGRDLTDPESIANGIGPVCATKFEGV